MTGVSSQTLCIKLCNYSRKRKTLCNGGIQTVAYRVLNKTPLGIELLGTQRNETQGFLYIRDRLIGEKSVINAGPKH
jgi:hypothetical protein